MKLIAAYIHSANNFKRKIINFDPKYKIEVHEENLNFNISLIKLAKFNKLFDHVKKNLTITVLSGVNGAGKSTILQTLDFSYKHEFLLIYIKFEELLYIEGNFKQVIPNSIIINNKTVFKDMPIMKSYFSLEEHEDNIALYNFYDQYERRRMLHFSYNIFHKLDDSYTRNIGAYYSKRNSVNSEFLESFLIFSNNKTKISQVFNSKLRDYKICLKLKNFGKFFSDEKFNKGLINSEHVALQKEILDTYNKITEKYQLIAPPSIFKLHSSVKEETITISISNVLTHVRTQTFNDTLSFWVTGTFNENHLVKAKELLVKIIDFESIDECNQFLIDEIEDYLGVGYRSSHYNWFISWLQAEKIENIEYSDNRYVIYLNDSSSIANGLTSRYIEELDSLKDMGIKYLVSLIFSNAKIMDSIATSQTLQSIFDIHEEDMAKGEKTLLDLVISLYKVIRLDQTYEKLDIENVYILLDEVDAHFHPELTRRIIYVFSKLFSNLKTHYSVIMSSNNEHILSDIPHTNIMVINDQVSLDVGNMAKKTFINHIADIANDYLILEKPIGEFAYEYVQNLIAKIENNDLSSVSLDDIDIIGNDFLRNYLLNQYRRIKGT